MARLRGSALRLLAFNLLVVFVPVIGVLYLDVYESRLLQAQEREMVQQARLMAAVLGDAPQIDVAFIERAFARLERRTEARLQVFDAQGSLIADSRDTPVPVAFDSRAEYQTVARRATPAVRDRAFTSSVPGWRICAKSAPARDPGSSPKTFHQRTPASRIRKRSRRSRDVMAHRPEELRASGP